MSRLLLPSSAGGLELSPPRQSPSIRVFDERDELEHRDRSFGSLSCVACKATPAAAPPRRAAPPVLGPAKATNTRPPEPELPRGPDRTTTLPDAVLARIFGLGCTKVPVQPMMLFIFI